jgi:hypothetical protein
VNSPVESPKPNQAARRKLVRGVFAAPAIMTVCSGNAFANTSNLRCLARNMTDMTNATPKVGGLDTWTRVQLHKATDGKYYVYGTQVQSVFTQSNSHYPGVGYWLGIDEATGNVHTAGTWSTPSTSMPQGATLNYSTPKYAIVRFDATGSVTGVGNAGAGYNVGASCWNSFKDVV